MARLGNCENTRSYLKIARLESNVKLPETSQFRPGLYSCGNSPGQYLRGFKMSSRPQSRHLDDVDDLFDDVEEYEPPIRPRPQLRYHAPPYQGHAPDHAAALSEEDFFHNKHASIGGESLPSFHSAAMNRTKGVMFDEFGPEFPSSTYLPRKNFPEDHRSYEFEQFNPPENRSDNRASVMYLYHAGFHGDDYMINELEDADDDEDMDPFGEDESLYSETGEEIVRRGNTIKRSHTAARREKNAIVSGVSYGGDELEDDDDFKPRLNYTKTIKKAKLVAGNYVVDCPVPKALLSTYGRMISDGNREMSFMRYTAATCGPSNYTAFNYSLRQSLYHPKRETEIMVCITMFNENDVLLGRTLKGVFENIADLNQRGDPAWGDGLWRKVVVTIICDGRIHVNLRAQQLMAALGCYQEGYAKSKINDKTVKAHIYEYTSTVGIDVVNDRVHLGPNSCPVQFIFCVKEQNAKKINSHRWALQAFGNDLNPRVVMMLDCGTRPSRDAFYHLWRAFRDPNVAGACGEMKASLGQGLRLLINPIVAAQHFEYKIANILDKPMESVFGFISVLPGAFSAYRYEALLNVEGQGPLEKYFKGEYLSQGSTITPDDDERQVRERNYHEAGIFSSNMYLAEDRILCFELTAKRGHNYVLRYVNEAKAETDVPEHIDEFVLQRRRWLNGSLFAACYALFHWTSIWRLNHSLLRKLVLQMEFYYQLMTILVSWFSLASFFLVFRILTANLGADDLKFAVGKYLAVLLLWLYLACVVSTFVLAFGNTPRGTKTFYLVIACVFAVLMVYMLFAAVFLAVHAVQVVLHDADGHFRAVDLFTNSKFRDLIISMGATYALYFVGAFMYGNPTFMFTSFLQYLLLSPSYVNILTIYSFCNIHDVSWGTKGVEQAKDLGLAKSVGPNKDELVMIAPGVTEELNESYLNALENLRTLPTTFEVVQVNAKKAKDDTYYALIRTMTVLIWMLTNAILIAIVLQVGGISDPNNCSGDNQNATVFLTIILWIVAALALYRFLGSSLYLMFKGIRPLKWRARRGSKKGSTD